MLRRLAALLGMLLLIAMLLALVWTVHLQRERMRAEPDDLISAMQSSPSLPLQLLVIARA